MSFCDFGNILAKVSSHTASAPFFHSFPSGLQLMSLKVYIIFLGSGFFFILCLNFYIFYWPASQITKCLLTWVLSLNPLKWVLNFSHHVFLFCSFHLKLFILQFIFLIILIITMILKSWLVTPLFGSTVHLFLLSISFLGPASCSTWQVWIWVFWGSRWCFHPPRGILPSSSQ